MANPTPEQEHNRSDVGSVDWHTPINDNFAAIDADIADLVSRLENAGMSMPSTGGYVLPAVGTQDWHQPLNDNFASIEADLQAVADIEDPLAFGRNGAGAPFPQFSDDQWIRTPLEPADHSSLANSQRSAE